MEVCIFKGRQVTGGTTINLLLQDGCGITLHGEVRMPYEAAHSVKHVVAPQGWGKHAVAWLGTHAYTPIGSTHPCLLNSVATCLSVSAEWLLHNIM
jgi:hypothetical protein